MAIRHHLTKLLWSAALTNQCSRPLTRRLIEALCQSRYGCESVNEILSKILKIITFPIWAPFVYSEQVESLFFFGYDVAKGINRLWRAFVYLIHFLGLFFIVTLLFVSIIAFIYVAAKEIGYEIIWLTNYYIHISNIINNPVSWAAATTIVATTIGIGHVQNLEVNRNRFIAEQKDRWEKEYEKRQERKRNIQNNL